MLSIIACIALGLISFLVIFVSGIVLGVRMEEEDRTRREALRLQNEHNGYDSLFNGQIEEINSPSLDK